MFEPYILTATLLTWILIRFWFDCVICAYLQIFTYLYNSTMQILKKDFLFKQCCNYGKAIRFPSSSRYAHLTTELKTNFYHTYHRKKFTPLRLNKFDKTWKALGIFLYSLKCKGQFKYLTQGYLPPPQSYQTKTTDAIN